MRVFNEPVFTNVTGTFASNTIDTASSVSLSLSGTSTGTIAGAVKLQVSNEFDPAGEMRAYQATQWVDLPGASVTLSGSGGTFLIPKIDVSYRWMRAVFTASGGTGSVTAWVKGCNF